MENYSIQKDFGVLAIENLQSQSQEIGGQEECPSHLLLGKYPDQKMWQLQKQPFRGVLKKRCSEKMQQIYRRTPMPKCDFNKVALQLY